MEHWAKMSFTDNQTLPNLTLLKIHLFSILNVVRFFYEVVLTVPFFLQQDIVIDLLNIP